MEAYIDRPRWYDRPLASFIFFTRLPFWRLRQPPKTCYESVVEYWPLTGWLTGGLMAATLFVGSMYLPWVVAVVLAIVVRLLVTGALHEDGLADFFDGFGGGGSDRSRILAIMKDSHIGTYGVLGLVVYELLLTAALFSIGDGAAMPLPLSLDGRGMAALAILAADPYAKMVAAQLVIMMPYARREDEAKARVVYRKMDWRAGVGLAVQGLLPMAAFLWLTGLPWQMVIFIPCVLMYFLYLLIWRRLRGYTGDCCGAVCLLVELAVYLVICSHPAY
jgi:adenosylcobinamide-GDP ribazoletransferase